MWASRHRDVSGLARFDRQRDADELRFHVVETRRFRIERHEFRIVDGLEPAVE
jgi:hypothetical protein